MVVPSYNEARRLNVERFREYLSQSSEVRFLFIDDGSRDSTKEVLYRLCQGYEERASVLVNAVNRGKAEAVRLGVLHGLQFEPQFIGYWDADLATPLETVPHFLKVLDDRPETQMVFGSRVQLLGREIQRQAARHYLGRVFATAVSVVLRMPIYDSQCGAKLFRVNGGVAKVFAEPFLSKWVFDVEILARYLRLYEGDTKRLEKAIYEYPLEVWVDVAGSKVKAADFFRAFFDILRIKGKYL